MLKQQHDRVRMRTPAMNAARRHPHAMHSPEAEMEGEPY